jgi:hypothetical protein
MLVDCQQFKKKNLLLFRLLFQINFNNELKQQKRCYIYKEHMNMHEHNTQRTATSVPLHCADTGVREQLPVRFCL